MQAALHSLTGVHRDDDGRHADADAAHDARGVKGPDRVRVDGLHDGTDAEDGRREDDGPSATELGGEGPDEETGEES